MAVRLFGRPFLQQSSFRGEAGPSDKYKSRLPLGPAELESTSRRARIWKMSERPERYGTLSTWIVGNKLTLEARTSV